MVEQKDFQPSFETELIAQKLRTSNRWKLYEPLTYRHAPADAITVPTGFVTDGGTIPPPFNAVYQNDGPELRAFVLHDWLYDQRNVHGRSRYECDCLLLEAMQAEGSPFWRRWPIYVAVRSAGWIWWMKADKEEREHA